MRIPMATRIWCSIFLLCVGIILFPAYEHWVATRTWVAVDTPISLAPGHVRIDDFRVNQSAAYYIGIKLDDYDYWRYPDCQDYKAIQTRWWLSRDGRLVSTWKDYWGDFWGTGPNGPARGTGLGAFDSTSGPYSLDVEMLPGAACLQAFHPRLRVDADETEYARGGWIYAMAILASFGLIGVSIAFPLASLASAAAQPRVTGGESLPIFDTLRAERESTRRKLLLAERASTLPTIGYVYAQTCLVLFLGIVPFFCNWGRSNGIPVRVLRPGVIQASTEGGMKGLLVYVDRGGNLYFNSKRIKAEELPRALQAEFALRADWSVYVDGDSDAEYADVVRAMDLVRSAQGKVIMVTPSLRAEAEARRN
jgi:biopolymer transport protein ExbD